MEARRFFALGARAEVSENRVAIEGEATAEIWVRQDRWSFPRTTSRRKVEDVKKLGIQTAIEILAIICN